MANILAVTTRTAADVLGTVSSAATTVSHGFTAVADLASAASMHSGAYRRRTALSIAADEKRALRRSLVTKSLEDARFYSDISKELSANPDLVEHYEEALADYIAATEKAHAELDGNPKLAIAAE